MVQDQLFESSLFESVAIQSLLYELYPTPETDLIHTVNHQPLLPQGGTKNKARHVCCENDTSETGQATPESDQATHGVRRNDTAHLQDLLHFGECVKSKKYVKGPQLTAYNYLAS